MQDIKRITFVGNFDVDYSTESHHAKTFEKLGIKVIRLQENRVDFQTILNEALESNLLYWTHTHNFRVQGDIGILKSLKEQNIPIVGYHLDLWLGIQRERDLDNDSYWSYLDYFFCTDKLMVEYLNNQPNKPKAFYLPAGVFEDETYLAEPNREKYPHDIIFVGSRGYHPEWPYREKLISWLHETYGDRFAQYGGGGLGTIRGHELNALYASAKVVVGDTLCKGFDYPYYFSDRIFETTGRGGFLIFPYIKGIEDHFETTTYNESIEIWSSFPIELVTYKFNNFGDLKEYIDYFLEHNSEREAIRKAGHERTKRDHTYTQRLSKMLETIQAEQNGRD